MPMGLQGAPGTFQEVMNEVLQQEIREGFVQVYMDDIGISSENLESHLLHVSRVVSRIGEHKLKVKKSKCELVKTEIKFLGHLVSYDSIKPDPSRVSVLFSYPKPNTLAQLWSFMGLANYNRKFIHSFAKLAQPLYNLQETKDLDPKFKKKNGGIKGEKIILNWTDEATKAFEKIRTVLTSDSVLIMPDFKKEFILRTDASDKGYGAVLAQERDGEVKPIAFYSKTMTKAQLNYSTPEKELLAIIMSIEHFHQYLYGVDFTIQTDHQPLTWLLNKKDPSARMERWLIRIRNYDFSIKYKAGKLNGDADALSRWHYDTSIGENEADYNDQIICEIEIINQSNANDLYSNNNYKIEEQSKDENIL
jgi:hypothetical protein